MGSLRGGEEEEAACGDVPGAAGAWGDGEGEGCGYVFWGEGAEFLVQCFWRMEWGGGRSGEVGGGWGDCVVGAGMLGGGVVGGGGTR